MQNNQDWEQRLRDLEVEVNPEPEKSKLSSQFESYLNQLKNWYNALPTPGKVVVGIGGVLVTFSILNSVLKLVVSLISLVILAVVLYGVYKFFMTSDPAKND